MSETVKAIELTGTIDENCNLSFEEKLPVKGPCRVRVLVLLGENQDLEEQEWLRSGASNPAFDFLKDPAEDIFTLGDGKPFGDKG